MNINLFHKTFLSMNTRMDVVFWGNDYSLHCKVFEEIKKKTIDLEKVLSRFDSQADTYYLNQNAHKEEIKVSSILFKVIESCIEFKNLTNGYFDVCYQSRMNEDLTERNDLQLNYNTSGIRFLNDNIKLDFGAIGKGIALDHVRNILKLYGIENALVSFGESSVLTIGRHPFGEYWPFSFQSQNGINEELQLTNDCISISGLHNGMAHIKNPNTGELCQSKRTVCVVTDDPISAEVLSTAIIAAPIKEHSQILENFKVRKVLYNSISA
nr:FAD:protein FMN transferase [uncultured Carboxylicivirga sp.]